MELLVLSLFALRQAVEVIVVTVMYQLHGRMLGAADHFEVGMRQKVGIGGRFWF